uniref:Tyrosine-protein kinase n=1 Tax=Strongyloides papillosus TaxID=174720 RepID=A0A0N5CGT5_STREA
MCPKSRPNTMDRKDASRSSNPMLVKATKLKTCTITRDIAKPNSTSLKKKKEKLFNALYTRKEPVHSDGDIEGQRYFHGLLPRKYIGIRFKNPGDFLVLLKYKGGEPHYFLELLDADLIVKRISIEKDDNGYYLGINDENVVSLSSIPLLIKYYHHKQVPGYICLKYPIQRPNTFYSHSVIKYNRNDDLIERGTFSSIYKCTITDGFNKGTVAVIKIPECGKKETDKDYIKTVKRTAKIIIKEASLMEEIEDKNILTFYGLCMDRLPVSLLIEYCPLGNLQTHLSKEKENICVGELLYYCYDIAKGMKYLSKCQIVHRNLSVSNVFLSTNGLLKIGSFSKACKFSCTELLPFALSLRYQPPEYLLNKNVEVCESYDVWSYGATVIEIFNNGELPLKEVNDEKFTEMVQQNNFFPIPSRCPETWAFGMKNGVFVTPAASRFSFRHLQELLEAILRRSDLYPLPKPEASALAKRGILRNFICP